MRTRAEAGSAPRSTGRTALATLLTAALVAGVLAFTSDVITAGDAEAAPAHNGGADGLAVVGPVDHSPETGGYPLWYEDTNGVRLELCPDVTDPHCIAAPRPSISQPVSFPDNFPDEAFWWAGSASLATASGGALLDMALEAAFAVGPVAPGDQVAFSRIRLRVDGLPVGVYTVTHPYGVDTYTVDAAAASAKRSINVTRDVGDFSGGGSFDVALNGPTGPFLVWDTDQALLPAGYLADPLTPHTVTGSPYGTNVFRIEGPPGAFTGSIDACPGVIDGSCVSTDLFTVQAKESVRAGVEVTRAGSSTDGTTGYTDVFARSLPGETIMVTGDGVLQTQMLGDGTGLYYVRVTHGPTAPATLTVTNTSDVPPSIAVVSGLTDTVHVASAVFDRDLSTLTVTAESTDAGAVLNLLSSAAVVTTGAPGGTYTFELTGLAVPPAEVTVISSAGGSDSDDVVVIGAGVAPVPLEAVVAAIPGPLQPGEIFGLDGSGSTGSPETYVWTQTMGTPIPPFDGAAPVTGAVIDGLVAPDLGASGGELRFTLSVARGTEAAAPSETGVMVLGTTTITPPIADAGPDQNGLVPGTVAWLDGSGSTDAATYSWTQVAGPTVVLSDPTVGNPAFTVPASAGPLRFELTTTNVAGTSTDLVDLTIDLDDVATTRATFKGGGKAEWRIDGTTQYCTGVNIVTIELVRDLPPGTPEVVELIGTTVSAPAFPGCDWQLRLRDEGPTPNNGDRLRLTTSLGGFRDNVRIQRG